MSRMPFGKHKGVPIEDIPDDYLLWLIDNVEMTPWLNVAVRCEVASRGYDLGNFGERKPPPKDPPPPPPPFPPFDVRKAPRADVLTEFVSLGLKAATRHYHPDAGGTHEQMIEFTNAADWLRTLLRYLPT